MMTIEEYEVLQEPGYSSELSNGTGKKRGRQPKAENKPERKTSVKTNTVKLNGPQLVKLWHLVTGGNLIISNDNEFHISKESLDTVLPQILERL